MTGREVHAMTTRAQLFEIAHALGHRNPSVYETRRGEFFSTCSCGYVSTTRATFVNALQAGVHHVLSAAMIVDRDARRNGIRLTPEALAEYARRQRPPRAARTEIPADAHLVAS